MRILQGCRILIFLAAIIHSHSEIRLATAQPMAGAKDKDYVAARTQPQPLARWQVREYGCAGNPRTWELLQHDVKRNLPLDLVWPRIAGAERYKVKVQGIRSSHPPVTYDARTNRMTLKPGDLPAGRYEWTVEVYGPEGKFLGNIETIDPVEDFAIAPAEPLRPNGKRALIDLGHTCGNIVGWGSNNHGQSMVRELLEEAGFAVEVNEREALTPQRLKGIDLLIEDYYWAGWPAFKAYSKEELEAVRGFVAGGGALLLTGCDRADDSEGGKMIPAGNALAECFGLRFAFPPGLPPILNAGVTSSMSGLDDESFMQPIQLQLGLTVQGEGRSLLEAYGNSCARLRTVGKGKVLVAGIGMGLLDCYLGEFGSARAPHQRLFYQFIHELTGVNWRKQCRPEFVQLVLSPSQGNPFLVTKQPEGAPGAVGQPKQAPAPPRAARAWETAEGAATTVSQRPAGLFPNVKIQYRTENRHRMDDYPYQEQRWEGATHVLGTIHRPVAWTREKSPYIMDENVIVAPEGLLTIGPGVTVKITRPADPTSLINAYIGLLVWGRLEAEGTPQAMIRFIPAAGPPQPRREWMGIHLYSRARPSLLKWAVVEGAIDGVSGYGLALISHCVLRGCFAGLCLNQQFVGTAVHNVSTGNQNGIWLHTTAPEAAIANNIFWDNEQGIEALWDAAPWADHNLIWSARGVQRAYYQFEPGPQDLYDDPLFVDPEAGDYRLAAKSPAREMATDRTDLGLAAESWSEQAAKMENERWLAGGGRQLWAEGLDLEREQPAQARAKFEAALARPLDPDLRDLVYCALGRTLIALRESAQAAQYLRLVLEHSDNPQRRDMARRHLAEALASQEKTDEAKALLEKLEWPRSKVWAEAARARLAALGGDARQALNALAADRQKDPYRYLRALGEMIDEARRSDRLAQAAALCEGYDAFPESPEGSRERLMVAGQCMGTRQRDTAEKLLKKIVEADPFGRETQRALALLAELAAGRNQPEEAKKYREQLCSDYYLFTTEAAAARGAMDFKPLSPRQMILLDESQGESSPYDRDFKGSCNFGQFEVMKILTRAGCKVHSNAATRRLSLAEMRYYGLIIMNGRYGGTDEPPLPQQLIEDLAAYVREGGNLLVVASGSRLGSGKEAQFYNPLLRRFGLSFRENSDIPWTQVACQATTHSAVSGINAFVALGGVQVDGPGEVLGTNNGEPVLVLRQIGKGRVVAAGLGTAWRGNTMNATRSGEESPAGLNAKLLGALADWLLARAPEQAPPGAMPGQEQNRPPAASGLAQSATATRPRPAAPTPRQAIAQ